VGDEVVVGGVELERRRHGRVEAESESLHRCLGGRRRDRWIAGSAPVRRVGLSSLRLLSRTPISAGNRRTVPNFPYSIVFFFFSKFCYVRARPGA
jgi:hypothetical protein